MQYVLYTTDLYATYDMLYLIYYIVYLIQYIYINIFDILHEILYTKPPKQ
jgi:hypothetical protein